MFNRRARRAVITLALSAGVLTAVALPAYAASDLVQKKTVSGPNGRSGTALRYAGSSGNSVTLIAVDSDGPGGKCTETWVDYSTKPHEHWNPGMLVNCSGGTKTVAGALTNNGKTISGMGVVVCEVPNTSGPIVRNSNNCKGQLSAMWLHSGQRYSNFDVTADQMPSGIQVYF
jgi:hypothetical protein